MRILVVEDEQRIAAFLAQGLREEGHRVDVAADLSSARTALDTGRFELLLVDRRLPDGDGLDLVRELRWKRRAVPAICLTARDSVPDRVEGGDVVGPESGDEWKEVPSPEAYKEYTLEGEAKAFRRPLGRKIGVVAFPFDSSIAQCEGMAIVAVGLVGQRPHGAFRERGGAVVGSQAVGIVLPR